MHSCIEPQAERKDRGTVWKKEISRKVEKQSDRNRCTENTEEHKHAANHINITTVYSNMIVYSKQRTMHFQQSQILSLATGNTSFWLRNDFSSLLSPYHENICRCIMSLKMYVALDSLG